MATLTLRSDNTVTDRHRKVSSEGHKGRTALDILFFFFFLNWLLFIYLFIWLCWVFVSVRGLSLVAASGGHPSSRCAGLSLSRPLLLQSTGSRRAGSVVVAHGPRCSEACGIFPDLGSNPCLLHWQADSQPLRHQGSPVLDILIFHPRYTPLCCPLLSLLLDVGLYQIQMNLLVF